jgi:NAD(P)-dependent dehydrogenase (short-subunit alcohol dehydrogenase family)
LKDAGAETVSLDVTASPAEIKAVVAKVLEGGPIDVLVNNAGYIEAGLGEEARYVDSALRSRREHQADRYYSYESYVAQLETNFFCVIRSLRRFSHTFVRRSPEPLCSLAHPAIFLESQGPARYVQ